MRVCVPDVNVGAARRPPVGAALVPQPPSSTDASLKLDLNAYLTIEPGEVTARIRVEPDARSRSLTIEWWTPDGVGGSHLISLEGDRAPIRFTYPIKRLTEGQYLVSATLGRNDGTTVRRNRRVIVIDQAGSMSSVQGIADELTW